MSRNFTFFQSFGEAAMMMPDDERLAFYDAIVRFAILEEEPTDLPGSAKLVFAAIRPIVANSVRDTLNGSQGGRPRKTPLETPLKTPTKTPLKTSTKKPDENLMYSNVEECNVNVGEDKKVAKASATSSKKSSLINEWLLTLPPVWAELMRFWLKYKQERGESYKGLQGPKAALKNLQEFSNNDPAKAKAVIDQSIANNWAGLFNLKNEKSNGTDKKPFGQSYADRIIVPNREIFKTEQGTI